MARHDCSSKRRGGRLGAQTDHALHHDEAVQGDPARDDETLRTVSRQNRIDLPGLGAGDLVVRRCLRQRGGVRACRQRGPVGGRAW